MLSIAPTLARFHKATSALATLLALSGVLTARAETYQVDLVNPALPNAAANGVSGWNTTSDCQQTVTSSNGRYVVMCSDASNLIPNVTYPEVGDDLFLFDRQTNTATLVTHQAGAPLVAASGSGSPVAVSDDGNWVLFHSDARNMVAGYQQSVSNGDLFLFERATTNISLVSRQANNPLRGTGSVDGHGMSPDGEWILFSTSNDNVISGVVDTNNSDDVFLFQRSTGAYTLVSHTNANPAQTGNGTSGTAEMSLDASRIVFSSSATDIVPGVIDNNNAPDVFVYERSSGLSSLVSYSRSALNQTSGSSSVISGLSMDGRWVLITTRARDFVNDVVDYLNYRDLYLHDLEAGTRILVSHIANNPLQVGGWEAEPVDMSDDANWVLFKSMRNDYVAGVIDQNSDRDLFLFNRSNSNIVLVTHSNVNPLRTVNGHISSAMISGNGTKVAYETDAIDAPGVQVDSNGTWDALLFDTATQSTRLVSRKIGQTQMSANAGSGIQSISRDGGTTVISSSASDLIASGQDTNDINDFYVDTGPAQAVSLLTRNAVSVPSTPNRGSRCSDVSDDGRWVLCQTESSNLIPGISAGNFVFLTDRQTGTRTLVSRALGAPTVPANGVTEAVALSADGRYALFTSTGNNLISGLVDNAIQYADPYLFDRMTGQTILVGRRLNQPATTPTQAVLPIALSDDGSKVLLASQASDLVPGVSDSNGTQDVFLFDRSSETTTLVSRSAVNANATGNGYAVGVTLSATGNVVLFSSGATDVVPGQVDTNNFHDLFTFDSATGQYRLVTGAFTSNSTTVNSFSGSGSLSDNGRYVAFMSEASNVLAGVTYASSLRQAYLFDRITGVTSLVSHAPSNALEAGDRESDFGGPVRRRVSDQGDVLFSSTSTNLAAGLGSNPSGRRHIYVYQRESQQLKLLSHAPGQPAVYGNGDSTPISISADGNRVWFISYATNLTQPPSGTAGFAWYIANVGADQLSSFPAPFPSDTYGAASSPDLRFGIFSQYNAATSDGVADGNREYDAVFGSIRQQVTATAGSGGSTTPSGVIAVVPGATTTLTITPAIGHSIASVSGCGGVWSGGSSFTTAVVLADCTVTALFQPNLYQVVYLAGPHGSLSGDTTQTIAHGSSGTAVTAVPDVGYRFVAWSDGSSSNPRVDNNVSAALNVTAQFANSSPTIAPLTNRTVHEDSGMTPITISVADLETPGSQLLVSAQSSQPTLITDPSVTNAANPYERTLQLTPSADQNGGPVTITVRVEDGAGAVAQGPFQISVLPVNDAPVVTLSGDRVHAAATAGTQEVQGFATVDLGPPDEDSSQTTSSIQVAVVSDPAGVLMTLPTIAIDGTLTYALTGNNGYASLSVTARDDGGTERGGRDVSAAKTFAIQVGPAADLQIAVRNGRNSVVTGDTVRYALVIANAGPDLVPLAGLLSQFSSELSVLTWRCEAAWSSGSCPSPDQGLGPPNLDVNLGINQFLRFTVEAQVVGPVGSTIQATTQASTPMGIAAITAVNDQAIDADPIVPSATFYDGFEESLSGLTVPGADAALRR